MFVVTVQTNPAAGHLLPQESVYMCETWAIVEGAVILEGVQDGPSHVVYSVHGMMSMESVEVEDE